MECHPYFVDKNLIEFCRSKEIHVTVVGPFGFPARPGREKREIKLLDDPIILELAEKKGKTPAQIVLRFLLQMGVSIVTRGKVEEAQIQKLNKMERRMKMEYLRDHKDYPFHHFIF